MYCTSTRPSRLGWPARLYIEYTVTFSYKVMRRLLEKHIKSFYKSSNYIWLKDIHVCKRL